MKPDDRICYCFEVSLRKLMHYARRERPKRASQMSGCLDAGTGCGWCVPFLKKIWADPGGFDLEELTPEAYARARTEYRARLGAGGARNAF